MFKNISDNIIENPTQSAFLIQMKSNANKTTNDKRQLSR